MASNSGCSNSEGPTGLAMMKHWLNTGAGADMTFLVGTGKEQQIISAHTLVLSTASSVFKTMFEFDKLEHNPGEPIVVPVPDVDVVTFRTMLSFIYTNSLELTSENVLPLLAIAKKYAIEGLRKACMNNLDSLDANTVLALLKHSQNHAMEDAVQKCLEYIDNNAEQVFESDGFLNIDQNLLSLITERSSLNIDEDQVYTSVVKWVTKTHQKKKPDVPITNENRRQIFQELLGPAFHHIRFSLISKQKFVQEIVPSGLLTDKELLSVFIHRSGQPVPVGYEMPFVAERRAGNELFESVPVLVKNGPVSRIIYYDGN